jgi:hypothetical protein
MSVFEHSELPVAAPSPLAGEGAHRSSAYSVVMRGLDPRIHLFSRKPSSKMMDCRVKPGNDEPGYFT